MNIPHFHCLVQDVIQFGPLLRTMAAQMMSDPLSIPGLLAHVGPGPLFDWIVHVAGLGAFSALHSLTSSQSSTSNPPSAVGGPLMTPAMNFRVRRLAEAWEFGSGKDYKL